MFYLGEYDEETAKDIKDYLDEAGLKVETRSCLAMDNDTTFSLKDRLSVIKELMKEKSERYERYVSALRSVLPQATPENFGDLFLKEMDPLLLEKRNQILALSKSRESKDQQSQNQEANDKESLTLEEGAGLKFSSDEWLDSALRISGALTFAKMLLSLNDIKIGEAVDDKLDDPVIEISIDPDDFEACPEQAKCHVDFYLEKSVILFVDEFTTPLVGDLDEEFWDEYPSEAHRLKSLGLLIEKLAISPSSRKMHFEEFVEECNMTLEDESGSLDVYGDDVADDLARVLEKGGVLKRKGDRLKWKSSS